MLVVSIAPGSVVARVETGPLPTGLAVTPNGREIWVVDTNLQCFVLDASSGSDCSGEVTVVSTASNRAIGTIGLGDVGTGSVDVAFSPDGGRAYVTNNGGESSGPDNLGSVTVVDTKTLRIIGQLKPVSLQLEDWAPTSVAVTGHEIWVSSASILPDAPAGGSVFVFSSPRSTHPPATGAPTDSPRQRRTEWSMSSQGATTP